nr:MAG TPA: hypothetical protein [Caudoviricetes sp.]
MFAAIRDVPIFHPSDLKNLDDKTIITQDSL